MSKSDLPVCAAHGLRYDPAAAPGCVVCQREARGEAAPTTSGPPMNEGLRPVHLVAGGAVAAVVVAGVIGALAIGGDGEVGRPGASSDPAHDALVAYVLAVREEREKLPVDETRRALEGMDVEARALTLDAAARRAQVEANVRQMREGRARVAALDVPEAARRHHQLQVQWYDQMIRLAQHSLLVLRDYERVRALIQRNRRDPRGSGGRAEEARRQQASVDRHVQESEALQQICARLVAELEREETRLDAAER